LYTQIEANVPLRTYIRSALCPHYRTTSFHHIPYLLKFSPTNIKQHSVGGEAGQLEYSLKKEEKRSSISSSRAEVRTHCPLRLCLLTDRNSFLVIILLNFLASWQRISFQIEVSPTLFLHIPYTPYTHRTHRT
jgi:hypothetical protein